jgi:hypothetical protein
VGREEVIPSSGNGVCEGREVGSNSVHNRSCSLASSWVDYLQSVEA